MLTCVLFGVVFGIACVLWDAWRMPEFVKQGEWNAGFYFGVIMTLWLLWLGRCIH